MDVACSSVMSIDLHIPMYQKSVSIKHILLLDIFNMSSCRSFRALMLVLAESNLEDLHENVTLKEILFWILKILVLFMDKELVSQNFLKNLHKKVNDFRVH